MADITDRYSATLIEKGTGRKFGISASGADGGTALAYFNAKAAITVADYCRGTHSIVLATAPTMNAGDQFSDAEFYFVKGSSGGGSGTGDGEGSNGNNIAACSAKRVTLRLENVTTDIAQRVGDELLDGEIDPANTLVSALAAAFRDGTGTGGYVASGGRFIA